jgi:N-acetylmuramoyl-L-alanine amidase
LATWRAVARRWRAAGAGGFALLLAACAPLPQRAGIPTRWEPSPNHDERRPNFVILHHTTNRAAEQALRTLTDPRRAVSSHYLVSRTGTVYQLVDERARAWHAGESNWGGNSDINSSSLGIELDNDGVEPYPDIQIDALLSLLRDIRQRYQIPAANFLGHADVAPRRKVDPGANFPWRKLAQQGFGLWCEPPLPEPSSSFDTVTALQALGYDVSNPDAALQAFRLHFLPSGQSPGTDDAQRQLLYCLVLKKTRPDNSRDGGGR